MLRSVLPLDQTSRSTASAISSGIRDRSLSDARASRSPSMLRPTEINSSSFSRVSSYKSRTSSVLARRSAAVGGADQLRLID